MKILVGNLLDSKATTLVNTVNCVGIMGKGIALSFKEKYPYMYKEYVDMCKNHQVKPGIPFLYQDLTGVSILNFPTKDHWKSPSKLSYIISGLSWFSENYALLGITSIAFPPLGCGNGGLSWKTVGPIMYEQLNSLPIEVEIFAPYGTKPEELTERFLSNNTIHQAKDIIGNKNIKFNQKWLLILSVVKKLNGNKYSLHVGRTIFQKICYVLTCQGVDTGFVFQKGSYGPYAPQVKEAINILSNANLMIEEQHGQMITVELTNSFKLDESLFTNDELLAVEKTYDLFSRITCTEQAEMVATILYAYEVLRKETSIVKDIELYNYICEWKPRWKVEKTNEVISTIQHLAILQWIGIKCTFKDIDE